VTTRFAIDLLHPGAIARTPTDWFLGPQGFQRLKFAALGALGALVVLLLAGILPAHGRLTWDSQKIKRLKQEGTATARDLRVLKADLRALSAEAKRQVPWSELLRTFSKQLPPTLKLRRVEFVRGAPQSARQQPAPTESPKGTFEIEAVTPLRPGGPPLLDVARFMADLMRDPAVNRRFQLKSWEIKPPSGGAGEGPQFLQIVIALTERVE